MITPSETFPDSLLRLPDTHDTLSVTHYRELDEDLRAQLEVPIYVGLLRGYPGEVAAGHKDDEWAWQRSNQILEDNPAATLSVTSAHATAKGTHPRAVHWWGTDPDTNDPTVGHLSAQIVYEGRPVSEENRLLIGVTGLYSAMRQMLAEGRTHITANVPERRAGGLALLATRLGVEHLVTPQLSPIKPDKVLVRAPIDDLRQGLAMTLTWLRTSHTSDGAS